MTEPTTPDEIREEIEHTRTEVAQTVDALADKLDVKAQVVHKVDDAKTAVANVADRARQAAPEPVQHALDSVGQAAAPVTDHLRPYRKQIVLAAVAVVAALIVVRRKRSE